MTSPEQRGDSLGAMQDWQLFEQKIQIKNGKQKVVGFNEPDGKYYQLEEGEELVHIKSEDGKGRKTFIRKGGVDTPFETWRKDK